MGAIAIGHGINLVCWEVCSKTIAIGWQSHLSPPASDAWESFRKHWLISYPWLSTLTTGDCLQFHSPPPANTGFKIYLISLFMRSKCLLKMTFHILSISDVMQAVNKNKKVCDHRAVDVYLHIPISLLQHKWTDTPIQCPAPSF